MGVSTFFTAPLVPSDVETDPDVIVTRTYDSTSLEEGQVVKVTLTMEFGPQALDNCYQLTDFVPSGLRPIVRPRGWGGFFGFNYPYRIDGQISPVRGAGLGLHIAKVNVERLGGAIWIDDSGSQGTSVRFSIPGLRSQQRHISASPGARISRRFGLSRKKVTVAKRVTVKETHRSRAA